MDLWKSNYKSMSYEQLLTVKLPVWMDAHSRDERMAYIAKELQIKSSTLRQGK